MDTLEVDEYFELGVRLGLKVNYLNMLGNIYPYNMQRAKLEVINEWMKNNGTQTQLFPFFNALHTMGYQELLHQLSEKYDIGI